MNTINDELLACYVDGTATPEEQVLVRNYLAQNPEEYERVLYMMDLDREDYIGEMPDRDSQDITRIPNHNKELPANNPAPLTQRIAYGAIACAVPQSIIGNLTASAAAFVPQKSMKTKGHITKRTKKSSRITGLQDRLLDMLNTIEK